MNTKVDAVKKKKCRLVIFPIDSKRAIGRIRRNEEKSRDRDLFRKIGVTEE
jgi:hypothetical protein